MKRSGEGALSLFLACKLQQRLLMVFQKEFFSKSLLQPEAPVTRGAEGKVWPPCTPGSGRTACGAGGTVQRRSTQVSAGLDQMPHTAVLPLAPSRGFWRGAGSSSRIGSAAGDSARSRDAFPPPPAQQNHRAVPPKQQPSFPRCLGSEAEFP